MTEAECLAKMVAPGTPRDSKWRKGVIQVHVTRACNESCFGCTQGSNLAGKPTFITPEQFAAALDSLKGYFGVVGMFGGNPAMHPEFEQLCSIMRNRVPFEQRGLWCNHPMKLANARAMRETFNPAYSNLNCHMNSAGYELFKAGWPEAPVFGLDKDSRHSPTLVAMRDVVRVECPSCKGRGMSTREGGLVDVIGVDGTSTRMKLGVTESCSTCNCRGSVPDEAKIYELASNCDINKYWSAMVGVFRGELRAWFCEIAGAQSILHQDEPDYPDTGIPIDADGMSTSRDVRSRWFGWGTENTGPNDGPSMYRWWQAPMRMFDHQVRRHCFDCGVPLRRRGELAMSTDGTEEFSETHRSVAVPKRKGRRVELVTVDAGPHVAKTTDYMGNAAR